MIRTTVVGSWPPAPALGEPLARYFHGELDGEAAEALLRQVATIAIDEQRACGLDNHTGGETSADSFILHFPGCLSGVAPTEDHDAWDGRGTYRIVGPIGAPEGLGIAQAYQRERQIDETIRKVTFPGPSEISMRIEPEEDRRTIWPVLIKIIRAEMRECVALGANDLQIDLPHIAMGLVDERWGWTTDNAAELVRQLFTGFEDVRRSVHLCYGDFDAQTWTQRRSFYPLLPLIQALEGSIDRVVLEFSLPEQWADRRLLKEIPASIEIAVGIVDVKSPQVETLQEIETKILELLNYVPPERLLICPSCGFGRRNPALAINKSRMMVQAVDAINVRLDNSR